MQGLCSQVSDFKVSLIVQIILFYSVMGCSNTTCLNGGTCEDSAEGDYDCVCLVGSYGRNCEKGRFIYIEDNVQIKDKLNYSPNAGTTLYKMRLFSKMFSVDSCLY